MDNQEQRLEAYEKMHQNVIHFLFGGSLKAIFVLLFSYTAETRNLGGGSVFLCMILHGITNTLLSVFVIKGNAVLIIGLVILTVVSIISMLGTGRFAWTENRMK